MADWMSDWMADCMTDWMADYMTDWVTDCMTDLMADTGWLTGWLGCCFIFFLFGVSRWDTLIIPLESNGDVGDHNVGHGSQT
jgi:hypothetical protein